jgi:putative ABC transport system permease protein
LRYLTRRRSLSLLQILGIACGVAAVTGMVLSSGSALSSFSDAVSFLQGRATHLIERPAGSMGEKILPEMMRDPAVSHLSPVIDRRLRLEDGSLIRVLGIDPFLDRHIRPEFSRLPAGDERGKTPEGNMDFLLDERAVFLEARLAEQMGLSAGREFKTSRGPLRMIGTFANPSGEPLILMDIAHAQEMFDLPGQVDHVDLILDNEADFRSRWKTGFRIQSTGERRETFSAMVGAFRLNLEAMSLMALFVAVFLIYNTTMFTVVSRRKDAGILRSLGADRREVIFAFLAEIMLLGSVGGAIGSILGYLLSHFLTTIIGSTISNLYFFLRPTPPGWSFLILLSGILLGCGASLLGSILSLVELARIDPVEALRGRTASRRSGKTALKAAYAGLAILTISFLVLVLSGKQIYTAYAATFGILLGLSLLTGLFLVYAAPVLKAFLYRIGGISGKVAAGNIRQNLGRSGVAVAAFMVALSMSIGLASMIGSFRDSLVWWMGTQLRGDVYISNASETEVPIDFYEELVSIKAIDGVDAYRKAKILYQGRTAYIAAVNAPVLQRFDRFAWLEGGDEHWEAVKKGGVIISESFARNFDVRPGDTITLEGIEGPARLRVEAAFYDYTSEHGVIMMDRKTYLGLYNDHAISSVAVFFDPANPRRLELIETVKEKANARGLPVFTQKQFYNNILELFDSTFVVTRSMRIIAIIIAFFGIAGALMTLFIERQRDFGIMRALGFSTGQVSSMTLMEAIGMGLVSFLLSAFVGTLLAVILIKVINLRSFNWTIFFHIQWQPYIYTALTALLASLGAALYPIWKVRRNYPQMQIREE